MSSPHVAGSVALLLQAKGILRSHGNNDDDGNDESWRSNNDDERNISRARNNRVFTDAIEMPSASAVS